MKQVTLFSEAFATCAIPPEYAEAMDKCRVIKINIDRKTRRLNLIVDWGAQDAPPQELFDWMCGALKKTYGLTGINVRARCGETFTEDGMACLIDAAKQTLPSVNGFLNDCIPCFDAENAVLELTVRSGSIYMLEKLGAARLLEDQISECYGQRVSVKLIAGDDTPQDEEDYENERRLAMRKAMREESEAAEQKPSYVAKKPEQTQKKAFYREKARPAPQISDEKLLLGKPFGDVSTKMSELTPESGRVAVEGEVFHIEKKLLKSGVTTVLVADITDRTGSVRVKRLFDATKYAELLERMDEGAHLYLHVRGEIKIDRWEDDMILAPSDIYIGQKKERTDEADTKRVELHMHTQMSAMDGVSSVDELVGQAARWGHTAIAITDHGVAQAYPDAMKAAKQYGIKIIYGTEGYYVNNLEDVQIVIGDGDGDLDGDFVCFDIETTGTNPRQNGITEIAASVVRDGRVIDTFQTFVNPGHPIPQFITELTGITNGMVADAPCEGEAVARFLDFAAGRVLVAHNASFDIGFVERVCEDMGMPGGLTGVDTLAMSRILMPHLERHKLNSVADALKLPKFKHHRAEDDARILAMIFVRLAEMAKKEFGITRVSQLSDTLNDRRRENMEQNKDAKSLPVRHIILLVKNLTGLKNLYRLISESHLKHMNSRKNPIIPRNLLVKWREGLIVGSACEAGELFSAITEHAEWKQLCKIAKFYDFLEIQPIGNNEFMVRNGSAADDSVLKDYNRTIINLGESLGIPVVATGDVHFKDPEDEVFRRILMAGKGFSDADQQAPLYLRTTEEMLREFEYLPYKKAYEVVVTNPTRIADMCDTIKPVPDGMYPPEIPNSAEELQNITLHRAHELYGENLPAEVRRSLDRELGCIIKHGFDVMYMTAQKLIKGSNDRGYLVGSRGSVGSSVVAFFAGITEVNALPAHYRCPNCKNSDFNVGDIGCGADLPDKNCPICGAPYKKDGFDIPFETFLGFDGDKTPDIDLNFSGEDQANAHNQTIELFGEESVFRAGTIGTIAEKTAYGYVKKYNTERGIIASKAEEARLTLGCTGVKRTTGQHPGGMIVVPKHKSIYDFCAVQHPADDSSSSIITTHIDYHSIDNNLLKFDILGHDDPTMIKMLEDLTGVRAADIPLDDSETMSLYSTNEALNIPQDNIIGQTGAVAIPEFGTKFVRQMLVDTQPTSIEDLVRISGLSHGTDVWIGNAKELISAGTAPLKNCICCRDDILLYLISMGVEPKLSFTIMEAVRKGKGLKPEWEQAMLDKKVPEWYVESCKKEKYLFPKAHAAAYVIMGFRIAWYKMHRPLAFYAAYFTIRAAALDAEVMCAGDKALVDKIHETEDNKDAPAIEQDLAKSFEVAHEFYLRGLEFLPVDLYKSEALKFTLEDGKLRMPFVAMRGLGETAAISLVEERQKEKFLSIDDVIARSKVSRTTADTMKRAGVFGGLPDSSQMTMFA